MLYSVITDSIYNNLDKIERIFSFFNNNQMVSDFVIFNDEVIYSRFQYSVLNTFYLPAYYGNVIFVNIDEYFYYRDKINNKIILYLTKSDIHSIDRDNIKNCSIIIDDDNSNNLIWIKNDKL